MSAVATRLDVAKLAGVSPRTVSRVFSEEKGYSEETRARVLTVAEQIRYRPNRAAQALATGQGTSIGVLGGSLTDPHFAELAAALGTTLDANGKSMLLATHGYDPTCQQRALEMLHSDAAHGVVLLPTAGAMDAVHELVHAGLRVVLIDAPDDMSMLSAVRSSIELGARRAASYLTEAGRSRIAVLAATGADGGATPDMLIRGFKDSLVEGPLVEPWLVNVGTPSLRGVYAATRRLLSERPDVDAIFATSDTMAIGVLQAVHDAGRRVPDDVAVVGFGDLQIAAETSPPLTTVGIDRPSIADAAVRLLLGPRTVYAKTIEVEAQLVLRSSA